MSAGALSVGASAATWSPPFGALLEAAPDAMLILDRHGRIAHLNRALEALFGHDRPELLGQPVEMLLPDRFHGTHPLHPRHVNEPRTQPGLELAGRRKDGGEFPAEVSLSPLDWQGERLLIAAIRDVTEQRRAEAERAKLMQAQEAIRLRDEFLSVASHELRTPLTPIQLQIDGALRAARRGSEIDVVAVVRKLEALASGIHRLSTLVNQLLDLSRITAGRLDLERSLIDLVALVGRSILAFEDEAERAECTLEFEAPRAEIRGRWDGSRLEQVVTNLVSNALRYGAGRPVSIAIVESRPGWVQLFVRDQGIGIEPQHQALVFQRFERVSEARHKGGFGLGLWIVRQIVDAHGGTIRVYSQPGQGATFAVELPTGAQAGPGPEPLVLLVDDDAAVRKAFRGLIKAVGCRGLTATSGADALGLLHFGVRPSLILLDDEMPLLDGPAFAAELRARPELAAIPIVWLGERHVAGGERGPRLGKPFSQHEIGAVIAGLCPLPVVPAAPADEE